MFINYLSLLILSSGHRSSSIFSNLYAFSCQIRKSSLSKFTKFSKGNNYIIFGFQILPFLLWEGCIWAGTKLIAFSTLKFPSSLGIYCITPDISSGSSSFRAKNKSFKYLRFDLTLLWSCILQGDTFTARSKGLE